MQKNRPKRFIAPILLFFARLSKIGENGLTAGLIFNLPQRGAKGANKNYAALVLFWGKLNPPPSSPAVLPPLAAGLQLKEPARRESRPPGFVWFVWFAVSEHLHPVLSFAFG
jgi:hypothetical protein